LAFDRISPHLVEPWLVTWSGSRAEAFWAEAKDKLNAGQPLNVRCNELRNFTSGTRFGGPEFVAFATSIELAPTPANRHFGVVSY
jgi:hypothetical protein